MLKKILIVAVILSMALSNVCFGSGLIDITQITFSGRTIELHATASAGVTGGASMTVIKKGGSADNLSDVFAVKETVIDGDGKIFFAFKMPDIRNGVPTQGEYVIYIRAAQINKAEKSFYYITTEGRLALINIISKADEDKLYQIFASQSTDRAVLESMGILVAQYDGMNEATQRECMLQLKNNLTTANLTESILVSTFNLAVNLTLINTSSNSNIGDYLKSLNLSFNGVVYGDADIGVKQWINDMVYNSKPYNNAASINSVYSSANALYLVNHARYTQMETLMRENASILDISGNTAYTNYKRLTSDNKQKINEYIVSALSKNPVSSISTFVSVLEAAVASVHIDEGSVTGGGGGRGTTFNTTPATNNKIGTVANDEIFTDLASVPWAHEAIKAMYGKKIITGDGNGRFDPDRQITREEFVKMTVLALGIYDADAKCNFSDVPAGEWYYPYIASAVKAKLVEGVDTSTFGTGRVVTRQDMAVIACRGAENNGIAINSIKTSEDFTDNQDISDYALQSVEKLFAANIISGVGGNKFEPFGFSTRAQASKIIYNTFIAIRLFN